MPAAYLKAPAFKSWRCRKVNYASRRIADAALKMINDRPAFRQDGRVLCVYRCHRCECWHIGHTDPELTKMFRQQRDDQEGSLR